MKWRSLEESTTGLDTRSLREQFAERKELIARYVPAETQAVHRRVIADLKADGIESRALSVGAKAPQFELQDHNGKPVRSLDLLQPRTLVSFLCRAARGDEPGPGSGQGCRSEPDRDLSANRQTVLLHG